VALLAGKKSAVFRVGVEELSKSHFSGSDRRTVFLVPVWEARQTAGMRKLIDRLLSRIFERQVLVPVLFLAVVWLAMSLGTNFYLRWLRLVMTRCSVGIWRRRRRHHC